MAKGGIQNATPPDGHPVCPWQHVKYFDNFIRPLLHKASKLFGPYVGQGMTVLDIGCGRGFASLGLARLVGAGGTVIAADVQPEMLEMVQIRAREAGFSGRIQTHLCPPGRIGVTGPVDFVLAFWMLHEVPDAAAFLAEISAMLAPGGRFFVAEPLFHTSKRDFQGVIDRAATAGLVDPEYVRVFFSRAAVFAKKDR